MLATRQHVKEHNAISLLGMPRSHFSSANRAGWSFAVVAVSARALRWAGRVPAAVADPEDQTVE